MMNSVGWGSGLMLFQGVRSLSVVVFVIGVALLLFWAFKHLPESASWKWGWIFAVAGVVLYFLSLAAWPTSGMMGNFNGGMRWGGTWQNSPDAASTREEADGKALYEKLQSRQTSCQNLSDSDFELMGEYFMGQRLGTAHEQMNAMMRQMMSTDGEEQMHIIMGKRLSGCTTGSPSSR